MEWSRWAPLLAPSDPLQPGGPAEADAPGPTTLPPPPLPNRRSSSSSGGGPTWSHGGVPRPVTSSRQTRASGATRTAAYSGPSTRPAGCCRPPGPPTRECQLPACCLGALLPTASLRAAFASHGWRCRPLYPRRPQTPVSSPRRSPSLAGGGPPRASGTWAGSTPRRSRVGPGGMTRRGPSASSAAARGTAPSTKWRSARVVRFLK